MRREYKMTYEQHSRLLASCKPVPYLVAGGMIPTDLQQRVNDVWSDFGRALGFRWETVQPVPGKDDRYFTAEETDVE